MCSSTTAGPLNPILSFQIAIWSGAAYSDPSQDDPKESIFVNDHLGRYIWVYVFAPIVASVLAGYAAKLHLRNLWYTESISSSIYVSDQKEPQDERRAGSEAPFYNHYTRGSNGLFHPQNFCFCWSVSSDTKYHTASLNSNQLFA